MRSKLNFLIGVSLKKKVKTKWFILANLLIAVIIAGAINIDSLITFFGGEFNKKTVLYVVDQTKESFDIFKSQIETPNSLSKDKESKFEVKKYNKSVKEAQKQLKDKKEKGNVVIVFESNPENTLKITIITKAFLETTESALLNVALQGTKVALAESKSNVPKAELTKIYSQVKVNRVVLDKDKKTEEENLEMIMNTAFPILILPFFMLTIFLVQMIGAEVNDEKTTRGMEIIISNVSPKTHFFAKVIAGNLFVLLQGILLTLYGGLGLLIRILAGGGGIASEAASGLSAVFKSIMKSGLGEKLIYIVPLTLLLMVITFIAYSLLAGILASMTTNIEDFQQLQTPIMVISIIGYYLAIMAGVFNGAIFIKVAAFIPFISAILAPSLLMLGQFSIFETVISIILVIITNFLLIKYGLKIYKVGILNYSSSGLWKKMYKALKD